MFDVSLYDYDLPEELIAKFPLKERSSCRMLIVDREKGEYSIERFSSIADYLKEGDCLVINNSKVIKARLFGKKNGDGAKIELILISTEDRKRWRCLLKPGKRVKNGTKIKLTDNGFIPKDGVLEVWVEVIKKDPDGYFVIEFISDIDLLDILKVYGNIPLPPYIKRDVIASDEDDYQTVYAKESGSIAAPTAGLHFDMDILDRIRDKGVNIVEITLHVGYGTFKPIKSIDIRDHKMHSEEFFVSEKTASSINTTKEKGGRILAVGTTTTRVLESLADDEGYISHGSGDTDIFIHPPYKPKVVDMLLTNFHLPKSTLIMLVASFWSREKVLEAYSYAIKNRMRFYSYGDCMLLIKNRGEKDE